MIEGRYGARAGSPGLLASAPVSTPRKAPPAASRPPGGPDSPAPAPPPAAAAERESAAGGGAAAAGGSTGREATPARRRRRRPGSAAGGNAGAAKAGRGAANAGAAKTGAGEADAGKAGVPAGEAAGAAKPVAADAAGAKAGAKAGAAKAGAVKAGAAKPAGTKAAGAKPAGAKTGTARPAGAKAAKAGAAKAAAAKPGKKGGRPAIPPPPGPGLVVGPVPALARAAGAAALGAAVLLLVAPAFPLARSGGQDLGGAGNLFGFVPVLPLVAVVAAAGVLAVRGRLPRLALAALFPAGTLAAGLLLRTLALTDTGSRTTLDLPLGIGTSARYEVAAGLLVLAAGYALLVVAAVLAAAAWPRTVMEDDGGLDPLRPRLAAWGLAVGVLAALVLGMAPYASSIAPGTPTLPERSGLDLLGALVVALGAMIWAVISATLRPRLAVVGAYAGLAAVLLSEGLAAWLLVARSPVIGPSAGGVGTLLAGLAMAVLAWTALGGRGARRPAAVGG